MSTTLMDRLKNNDSGCFIIAEAGSNHNRDITLAKRLIDVAVEAKADAVKFQLFSANRMAARTRHEIVKIGDKFQQYGDTLHEIYRRNELPPEWLPKLHNYAASKGISFLCTPFDKKAVDELEKLDIPCYKIASYELVDLPLIKYVAKTGKPIILSTGMATLAEIEDAIEAANSVGNNNIAILHCGIEYPPRWEDVHLRAMDTIAKAFGYPVGYSDHTTGIEVPIAAVARGAQIIEKHFTLDNTLEGPDHTFALEPNELSQMVSSIRHVEAALGSSKKRPMAAEKIYMERGRRSLFASQVISKGTVITEEMLDVLRPGVGLKPKYMEIVIGRVARVDIAAHDPITWDVI